MGVQAQQAHGRTIFVTPPCCDRSTAPHCLRFEMTLLCQLCYRVPFESIIAKFVAWIYLSGLRISIKYLPQMLCQAQPRGLGTRAHQHFVSSSFLNSFI